MEYTVMYKAISNGRWCPYMTADTLNKAYYWAGCAVGEGTRKEDVKIIMKKEEEIKLEV